MGNRSRHPGVDRAMTAGGTGVRSALNTEKIERLYEAHGHAIADYCARRVEPERVDDAVADVFAVAWRKVSEVPDGDAALPWLYAVAYRVVFHHWRSAGRQRRLRVKVDGVLPGLPEDVSDVIVSREDHELVRRAASRLRPIDQEILRLLLWEEISQKEAAVVLGLSKNAVKQRALRARRNLAIEFRKLAGDFSPTMKERGGRP